MLDMVRLRRSYVIAAAIVWVAILIAAAVVLRDSPYLGSMLPILGGGAVFFVVLVPGWLFRGGKQ